MDAATIIADALAAIQLAQQLYTLGQDVGASLFQAEQLLTQKITLTDQQRADLVSQQQALAAQIAAANPNG